MSSDFDPLLWFVCKICRQAFPDTDKLKKHQIRKHAEDCKNVKCIVFEERLFNKQWIPSDNYFPESNSEFTNENLIEVVPLTSECGCHCHSISAVSVPAETQTESHLKPPKHNPCNPYVLVKRLTFVELNAALSRSAETPIVKCSPGSEERKRSNRCPSHGDVQSPKKKKAYVKHEEDQDAEQDLHADKSTLVPPPKLVQNIVSPNAKPRIHSLPKCVPCVSSFSPVSDPPVNARFDIKYNFTLQNVEDNALEKQQATATQTSNSQNQHIQKIESSINTSALASLFDFCNLNRTDGIDASGYFSETNNPEPTPISNDAYYSDAECFEIDNPVSPELFDDKNTGEQEQQLLPNSDVSEISRDPIEIIEIIPNAACDVQLNLNFNQQEVSATTSTNASAGLNASRSNNFLPAYFTLETSECETPRCSTRAIRNKSKINYSESHICSDCNLDFDTFDDLQDHQRLCTKQNRGNSTNIRTANRGNKNREDLVIQIDSDSDDDLEPHASKKPPNTYGGEVNRTSCRADASKVKTITLAVTDGDSDYDAAGDEDISESDSDHYIQPADVSLAKLREKDTTVDASTGTISQLRKQMQLNGNSNFKKENLALLKWLETQKGVRFPDGTKNKIVILTQKFVTSQCLGDNNYITCRLCETKLDTEFHLKNHLTNCWLHNQINHVYCVPCGRRFAHPHGLANHYQKELFAVRHATFRNKNGMQVVEGSPDVFELNKDNQRQISVEDNDLDPSDPISSDKDLPLLQWLQVERKNPHNVVALEPDPFTSTRDSLTAAFAISEASPIKCKLCLQLLTSEILLRNHVETCWSENKANHRYCVSCNRHYKSGPCLLRHKQTRHRKEESPWTCTLCHKDMKNILLFSAHQQSLQIFLGQNSYTESKWLRDAASTQGQEFPGQEGTMTNLSRWLIHFRKVPNSDGTANLVLIDPDPTINSYGDDIEINDENPVTCQLCLKKLTAIDDVKNHVKMCWLQNKEYHRYCLSCDKGFATPTEFQEHRTNEHSAPKNIVLFYREDKGDGSLLNVDGLEVNSDNPVTCKLCETELTSTLQVKIHRDNCWFHNKSRHVYCTICDCRFGDKDRLKDHSRYRHPIPKTCGPSEDKNNQPDNSIEPDNNLPLRQWLIIQKEDPKNVLALAPDPLTSETLVVSESSPVKCKLCGELLTTEALIKSHVTTCWLYNKEKHCYCVPCDRPLHTYYHLLLHNKSNHPKYPSFLPTTCHKCNQEFETKSEFTNHMKSLEQFQRQRENYKKPVKKVNSVENDDSSNTMSYLFEWLKRLRQIKNLDGTENIILVDPEPAGDNFEEINSENPITCRLCLHKFNKARGLNRHVRNCWTQNKARHRFCVICEKVFEKPRSLQDHTRVEHSQVAKASFSCQFCNQEFNDEKIYKMHQEAHKDPNFLPFNCPQCSESFKDKEELLKHVSASHRGREKVTGYKCKLCFKSFNAQYKLNNHNRAAHTGERPFKCKFPNCSYVTHANVNRGIHYNLMHTLEMGLESKRCLCPICGKSFSQKLCLNQHLKISHTQDKPYKCTYEGCTKDFKIKLALTEHVRVHTGEKPHVCEECGKSFAREWTFRKHRRSHAGTLNRAECHLCPRKFLGGWELKQHLKIHEQREQFNCQFCGVECATESYLKKHEKTHGNERESNRKGDSEFSTNYSYFQE